MDFVFAGQIMALAIIPEWKYYVSSFVCSHLRAIYHMAETRHKKTRMYFSTAGVEEGDRLHCDDLSIEEVE